MNTFYIIPSDNDVMHHGVLGMKWGIRRYQPYSVVPRGSGKSGKEIGEAANYSKSDIKAAKKNVKAGYKNVKKTYMKKNILDYKLKYDNKISKDDTKQKEHSEKLKEVKSIYDNAIKELEVAETVLGSEQFNKLLNKVNKNDALKSYLIGGIFSAPLISKGLGAKNNITMELNANKKAEETLKKQMEKYEQRKENGLPTRTTDIGSYESKFKVKTDKYGFLNTEVKSKNGSVNVYGDTYKDIINAASKYEKNKAKIDNMAINAAADHAYGWFEDSGGQGKNNFKNKLRVTGVSAYENGRASISVWEKDGYNILGGHSIDMDIDLNDLTKKPRYVSING